MIGISLSEALAVDALFGPWFKKPSWNAWKTLLAAVLGEPLSADQLEDFRAITGRQTPPQGPVEESGWVIGRRGGKSRALAVLGLYLALFKSYDQYLSPGEQAVVLVLSSTTRQARTILRYASGMLEKIPALGALVAEEDKDHITFSNGVVIEVGAASFRSVRGATIVGACCDELCFWRNEETSANPDVEILRALRPAMATIPNALLIMSSSPYSRKGELHSAWRRYYGKDDAPVLIAQASTKQMNPSISDAFLARKYEEDEASARAEFGAVWREDLADYVSDDAVTAVTAIGRAELPPSSGVSYKAFCDPSGGVRDAMTLAVGHLEGDIGVLDCTVEIRPPFNPSEAVAQCADVLRRYGISRVVADRYAGEWPRERFREHGIAFEHSAKPKSDLYLDLLSLINARRVELLDNRRLFTQLVGLERRTARSGKDSVDHGPSGFDDLANSVAGVLVGLDLDRRPSLIRKQDLQTGDSGVPLPRVTRGAFATLAISKTGFVAAVYAAKLLDGSMVIMDFSIAPTFADIFRTTASRLDELAKIVRAQSRRRPIFMLPVLARQAEIIGIDGVETPDHLHDPEQLLLCAAAHIAAGRVKVCEPANLRAQTSPFGAALDFRGGDVSDDPLRAAALLAIAVALDPDVTQSKAVA